MDNKSKNYTYTVIEEIYKIDPSLKEFEADLPNLISNLDNSRPKITIDEKFVRELRSSLISYRPASTPSNSPTSTPFFWWFARLAPVGISLVLLFVLVPELTNIPTESQPIDQPELETLEIAPASSDDTNNEMRMDALMPNNANDEIVDSESMMSMEAFATSLEVAPPLAGDNLTITSITMSEAGWIVVHKDQGGELGEMLHSSFLASGEYADLSLILSDDILYTEMVTVVVYTGSNPEEFDATLETLQIDPLNGSPMMVTVPVISELELELSE